MLLIDPFLPVPRAAIPLTIRWSSIAVVVSSVVGLGGGIPASLGGLVVVVALFPLHGWVRLRAARRWTDQPIEVQIDLTGPLPITRHDVPGFATERRDAMAGLLAVAAYAAVVCLLSLVVPDGSVIGRALSVGAPLVGAYALFQAMPGLPLEGGRLFRAFAWSVTASREGSARAAERYAGWIAVPMIIAGIWSLPMDGPRPSLGLVLAVAGWHLAVNSTASRRRIVWQIRSETVTLSRFVPGLVLPPQASLSHAARLVLEYEMPILVLPTAESAAGVIARETLQTLPRADWAVTPVGKAMTPAAAIPVLQATESVATAVRLLRDSGQSILLVSVGDYPRAAVTLPQMLGTLPI